MHAAYPPDRPKFSRKSAHRRPRAGRRWIPRLVAGCLMSPHTPSLDDIGIVRADPHFRARIKDSGHSSPEGRAGAGMGSSTTGGVGRLVLARVAPTTMTHAPIASRSVGSAPIAIAPIAIPPTVSPGD